MGLNCCRLLGPRPEEEVGPEEVGQPEAEEYEAGILLQTSPPRALAAAKRQMLGTPAVSKQAAFRDLVTAQMAERKAGDLAGSVLGLGLEFRLRPECEAWRLEQGGEVAGLTFSPNGQYLLVGGENATIVLWDVESKSKRLEAKTHGAVTAVAFAPDGHFFAAGDETSRCTLWRTATLDELATLVPNEGRVLSLALGSWPRPLLAVSLASGSVMLVSVPDMREEARVRPHGLLHGICFSPEGGVLAGGCGAEDAHGLATRRPSDKASTKAVLCWRLPRERGGACEQLASLPFEGTVHTTAFSPSGRLLAAGSEDQTARTFLVDGDFEQVARLACPAGVWCLAWTADSRFLASGGEDMQVSVWDVVTEQIVLQLPRMEDWLCAIAVSPTGNWLASAGFDGGGVKLHPVEVAKVGAPKQEPNERRGPAAEQQQQQQKQEQEQKQKQKQKQQQSVLLSGGSESGVSILVSQHADARKRSA